MLSASLNKIFPSFHPPSLSLSTLFLFLPFHHLPLQSLFLSTLLSLFIFHFTPYPPSFSLPFQSTPHHLRFLFFSTFFLLLPFLFSPHPLPLYLSNLPLATFVFSSSLLSFSFSLFFFLSSPSPSPPTLFHLCSSFSRPTSQSECFDRFSHKRTNA